jgi:hypothetical protein
MSITNSNFNQRSILGLHRDKVFTSPDTLSNFQLAVPFLQQNLGNVVTNNDASFNYNPSTKTLSVANISGTVIGGATSIAITETIDNIYYYITFVDSSGSEKTLRANTSGLSYNPQKDELNVSTIIGTGNCDFLTFTGNGNGLTNLRSDELDNDSITIGSTEIVLGNTVTSLIGLTSLSAGGLTLSVNSLSNGITGLTFSGSTILTMGNINANQFQGIFNGSFINNFTSLTGSIGLGVSSPSAPLHIRGIVSSSSYTYGIMIGEDSVNGNQKIRFNCSGGNYATLDYGTLGGVSKCSIEADVNSGEFSFYTGGSGIAAMKLDQNKNLGIGVSSASAKLDVGSINEYAQGVFKNQAATNPGQIVIRNTAYNEQIQIRSRYDYNDNHIFAYNDVYGNANLKLNNSMMILANGNIGISVETPSQKLDVYGSIVSRGNPADYNRGVQLTGRNEDGASYTNYNGGLRSWFGIGFESTLDGITRHMFNTRTGDFTMTGSLGIGTSTASYKLDIDSGASTYAIRFRNNLDADGWLFRNIADNKFAIHQENAGDRMTFDNDKVGIATGTPYRQFTIGGTINALMDFNPSSYTQFTIGSDSRGFLIYDDDVGGLAGYRFIINSSGNVGIGSFNDPQHKLEVLGDIKCGNPANSLTAIDIDTNSSYPYGMYIGGWSTGGRTNGNATIEMSVNLHIDSPSNGPYGPGNIYLNNYTLQSTFIRNRVDISDKRIKKDIVEIETPEQFNDTFEIIKKVGSYKYKYRDTYRENDLDQYGFIAQEVLEHYPVASKLAGDNLYLPNIMETLNFTYEVGDDNEYTFNIEGYDLDVNIKYLFYGFKEGVEQFDYIENIEPISNNTFTYTPAVVKEQEAPVYVKLVLVGTYTDDKLGVSKDRLFQLGFAGVRGLIDENEKMKNEILELKENQKKIINKLNSLISQNGWFQNSL